MKVHIYDYLNKNKIAQLDSSNFQTLLVTHHIDDFSTCEITYGINDSINRLAIRGFENIYIEDENGNIIFGGVYVSANISASEGKLVAYDHKWVLSRLVLDTPVMVSSGDQIIDKVEELINQAKSKRQIPIDFSREASAINTSFGADLRFEVGDDIATCLQKIIQTTYARWAIKYQKSDKDIYGLLRVRSIRGVTPEGIGISRSYDHSEDGSIVNIYFGEGDNSNTIQDFRIAFDLSNYASRSKLGVVINDSPAFITAPPDGVSSFLEFFFGRTENFVSDYRINSQATANEVSRINQNYQRLDMQVTLSPDFDVHLNAGDRVNVKIISPMIEGINNASARIDSITYNVKDGHTVRQLGINFMSPQKRVGTIGLLQEISKIQQRVDGLDKNYLNS